MGKYKQFYNSQQSRSYFPENYVVFDLETTAIDHKQEIIEVSAIKIHNKEIIDTFSYLIKPPSLISHISTSITGITNHMVADCPSIRQILPQFIDFIDSHILVGHNIASYDLPIISDLCEKSNLQIENSYVDTLHIARECILDMPNYKLTTLCSYFDIDTTYAHRSLHDCFMTHSCLHKLKDIFTHHGPRHYKADPIKIQKLLLSNENTKKYIFSQSYSQSTLLLQELQTELTDITSDKQVTELEIYRLKTWIDSHQELAGNYPFDQIFNLLNAIFDDHIISKAELNDVLTLFKELINPIQPIDPETPLSITNKHFCLSGEFSHGSKTEVENEITSRLGLIDSNVKKATHYVLVGSNGNSQWSCGNYGSKIKKALEMQTKGSSILIISEKDFFNYIENQKSFVKDLFDYFDCCDTTFCTKVTNNLLEIVNTYELPNNSLYLHTNLTTDGNISSKSICISEPEYPARTTGENKLTKSDTVLNIRSGYGVELLISNYHFKNIPLPDSAVMKKIKGDTRYSHILFSKDDPHLYKYINDNIIYCLKHYQSNSSFSCCSKFIECSNEMKCVHVNKLYSKGCMYRTNLESGNIFYGKNKNI